jgi:hypothetical protein
MSLSEQTVNKHNIKRAEVFQANGLCDLDVAFAEPKFVGYSDGASDCGLCGHQHIRWLYAIHFAAPDPMTALAKVFLEITRTHEVTLAPVGSKCITDWLDAIPESAAKLEALKHWASALKAANKAKRAKLLENKILKLGYSNSEALYDRAEPVRKALAAMNYKERAALCTTIGKDGWTHRSSVLTFTYRAKTGTLGYAKKAQALHDALVAIEPLLKAGSPVVEVSPEAEEITELLTLTAGGLSEADAELIIRGRETYRQGLDKALDDYEVDALADIGKKVLHYSSFASSKQRGFFEQLVKKAEASGSVSTEPAIAAAPATTFKSTSGISGARY